MGIRTLTIFDVPREVRAIGAANARRNLQLLLNNPQLTPEQRRELQDQLRWAGKWERLDIGNAVQRPTVDPPQVPVAQPAEQREPQHHTVELAESLALKQE